MDARTDPLRSLAAAIELELDEIVRFGKETMSDAERAAWEEAAIEDDIRVFKDGLPYAIRVPKPIRPRPDSTDDGSTAPVSRAPQALTSPEVKRIVADVESTGKTVRRLLTHHHDARKVAEAALSDARVASPPSTSQIPQAVTSPPPSRVDKAAALPFGAFLLVAAVGSLLSPTSVTILVAVFILVTAVVGACVVVFFKDKRVGAITVPLAIGTALPVFTAAYLLSSLIDPDSITRSIGSSPWEPMSRIGEAAFLSLAMSLGGGTVGLELVGLARAIAFVQLLLTVAVVAATLRWGWYQIINRINEQSDDL